MHQIVEAKWLRELITEPRILATRLRTEMHLLVKALAAKNWEDAVAAVAQPAEVEGAPTTPSAGGWDESRFEAAMAPYFAEYPRLASTAEARRHALTQITQTGERTWRVVQTLIDPEGDNLWAIHGEVDLRDASLVEDPLVRVVRIGT